uniref:Putative ATP-dependent RNA helicase DDX47 n=1 Tax=Lygus hesperus TaxID=30085 RepID=A0A0A9WBK6_LYGHE
MDFEKDIIRLLQLLPKLRRTYLFSATISSRVERLQSAALVNPILVQVSQTRKIVNNLEQYYVFCPCKHKDLYFFHLLQQFTKKTVIVFVSTCNVAQKLTLACEQLHHPAVALHGHMRQDTRLLMLEKFRQRKKTLLVATDVASRGLDIPNVDLVINYDVPIATKDYIHRVGRTARAGRSGIAITMVTQYDIEFVQRIERDIEEQLREYEVSRDRALMLQDSVNDALRVATMQFNEQNAKLFRRR